MMDKKYVSQIGEKKYANLDKKLGFQKCEQKP